jgi:hypothetical protein
LELKTANGRLKLDGAFRLVATGYLIGAGVIFVPLFALVTLAALASGAPMKVNGQVVEGSAGLVFALLPLVMVPFVVALQSVMFGGLVVFGLWLYQKRRPLRVVADEASEKVR